MVCNERIIVNKNGCFERKFYWNRDALRSLGDGFLIQKIERRTIASESFTLPDTINNPFCHTYYEAWNIKDGNPVYDDCSGGDFDDRWSYGVLSLIDPLGGVLKDYSSKYKTSGTITMYGTLFFVPENHELAPALCSCFSMGNVVFAGKLLSCYKCDVEMHFRRIFQHVFSHQWQLEEDDAFITAVAFELEQHKLSLEECTSYLEPCFGELPIYEKLRERILNEYSTMIF